MSDNPDTGTEQEETPVGLNDRAMFHMSENPDKTEAAAASFDASQYRLTPEQMDAYLAWADESGRAKPVTRLDRTQRIGTGPGERSVWDGVDARARRLFTLDQNMAKTDEAFSPSTQSTQAIYDSTEYLNHAIQQVQELDPELAYDLALADRFLAMFPEFAVTTRNGYGFAGITEQLQAELMGVSIDEWSALADEAFVKHTDVQDQFWTTFGHQLDPSTKDMVMISLAGLSEKEQTHVTALAAAYLDAHPLSTLQDQIEFSNFIHAKASDVYARENDQSLWGKFGRVGAHVFTNPANFLQDKVIGGVWNNAVDGADAWYRKELQLEETMAISMGIEVGSTGWYTFTGLAGMGIDIVIDPTNIALGMLAGAKFAKTAAVIGSGEKLGAGRKAGLVARQLVPWRSRKAAIAAGMPTGVRGRSARVGFLMFGKTQEGLVQTAKSKGVFEFLAKSNSYSEVVEQIPEMKKVDAGLVEAFVRRDNVDEVEELYRAALTGALYDTQSTAQVQFKDAVRDTQKAVNNILSDADQGLNAGDVAAAGKNGTFHSDTPIYLITPENEIEKILRTGKGSAGVSVSKGEKVAARAGKGEQILQVNNETRDNVLNAGRTILSRLKQTSEHTLKDGRKVIVHVGEQDGAKAVVATLGDGKTVVGSYIGDSVGVAEDIQRQGLGTILARLRGKTREEYLKGDASISEAGAALINKALGEPRPKANLPKNMGTAADPTKAGPVHYLSKKAKRINVSPGTKRHKEVVEWIGANTKYKNSGIRPDGTIRKDALQAYMKAHNVDAAAVNGDMVFRDMQRLLDEGLLVGFEGGSAQHVGLASAAQRRLAAKHELRMIQPKDGQTAKWVISDASVKVRSPRQDVRFWNKQFGVFSGKAYKDANWLVRRARGLVAKVFLDDIPPKIATGFANRNEGVQDLRKLLTQMGVDPNLVRNSIDSYLADPSQANVLQILRNAADDMGDPEIALGLMHFNQKATSPMEYATINKGEQMTEGLRVDGSEGLQPLLSVQTRDFVQLPESRAFSAHIRRAKRAQNRRFKFRNRGWGKTKNNREKIIEDFGRVLKGEAKAQWDEMDINERFAVAYAHVAPSGAKYGDGLGYAAQMGRMTNDAWARLRNVFSVSMLAWRPIAWMGNELLDNAWRAAMADGLSFFTHPFRSFASIHDARMIERAMVERVEYVSATRVVREAMEAVSGGTADEVLEAAAQFVPDIRNYVDKADSARDQAKAVTKFLNTEVITQSDTVKVLDNPLKQALYRQRKGYTAYQKYDLPAASGDEIFNPNWDEVSLTGMEQEFVGQVSSASFRHEWTVGRPRPLHRLKDYGRALHSNFHRDLKDPAVRAWLRQYVMTMEGGEDASHAARGFVNSPEWGKMEEPIKNMARFDLDADTVDEMTDLALAEWYFSNKIEPYMRDQLGDILDTENARSLLLGGTARVDIDGRIVNLDINDENTFFDLVDAANGTTFQMPESVIGLVNPRGVFGYGKEANGWKTPLKSYNQWALNKFGHGAPAALQRKPAYLNAFKQHKTRLVALGMNEKAADFVANQKAIEYINKSFFFVEAQTPALKAMNKIFPFFAAQYEIIKAWTWNIPAMNGLYGIGHARVLRAFDHIFNGLRGNGLLQPNYNKDGEVDGWNLMFSSDPHTENLAGQAISKAGHLALMAPSIMLEHIAGVFMESDIELFGDDISFRFNHPADFFGKGGGVLPTARFQFGMNPAMALAASQINEYLPLTTTSKQVEIPDRVNLDLYLAETGTEDKNAWLQANRHALIEAGVVTPEEFVQLANGTQGLTTVNLPKGITLYHPKTTMLSDWINTILFPYGQTKSIDEAISDYTPYVIKDIFKSMGLHNNDGEEGLTTWFPSMILGPTGRASMGTARTEAILTLEAQTGVLSRRAEVVEELASLEKGSDRWLELKDEADRIDDLIVEETKHAAASRAFIHTLYRLFIPFNPRIPTPEASLRDYYYNAKTTAEQWAEGNPMVMPFDGRNAQEAFNMVAAWAADPTGSQAKMEFLNQHGGRSSILAAIAPKTYWGKNGIPVYAKDINEYFRQVADGDIKPLPVGVVEYKYLSSLIQIEKEMAIVEKYGNDPEQQAMGILSDRYGYNELVEEYDARHDALDLDDYVLNDGIYNEWKARNEDLSYLDYVAREERELIQSANDILDVVELDLFPDNPREALELAKQLKSVRSAYYQLGELYNDSRYADFDISPRQAILNLYYKEQERYYDDLSKKYEKVGEATTEQERSEAYSRIAMWRDENEGKPFVVRGKQYPSPATYSWNSKSPEHKKAIIMQRMDGNPEWLTRLDISHIVEVYPKAAKYLPMSTEAQDIFTAKRMADLQIDRKYRVDGPLANNTTGAAKEKEAVEEQFRQRLSDAGEFGVLEWLDAYPIETYAAFGALPKELEFLVPNAVAIHRDLEGMGKSPLTNAAKERQRWFFTTVRDHLEKNPQTYDVFMDWGENAFQETTIEGIVAKMLGNYRGELN